VICSRLLDFVIDVSNRDSLEFNHQYRFPAGVFGCFIEVSHRDTYLRDFFRKLGFVEFNENFMGRSF
jgi:hypothetical protein